MKPYKKAAVNIAILTMILSAGISPGALAAAYSGADYDSSAYDSTTEINQSLKERQEKIINTFENNDYWAWKKMIGDNSRLSSLVGEFDFQRFVSARAAARQGKYAKAIQITESLKKSLSV